MKIKAFRYVILAKSCLLMVLAQSCGLDDFVRPVNAGDRIVFKAGDSYDNLPGTRTMYSGDGNYVGETLVRERIDWVEGDAIMIWSDKARTADGTRNWAGYNVSPAEADGARSFAEISNTESNGLVWGEGDHVFFSVYPSQGAYIQQSVISNGIISSVIPSSQTFSIQGDRLLPDMDYAGMYAAVKSRPSPSVHLAFKPMFTAFEFTIDSADDEEMTLSRFEMVSTGDLSGYFTAEISAASDSESSTASFVKGETQKHVSIDFGEGLVIRKGSPKSFTVFAIPFDIPDLTIRFTTVKGETKSLSLAYGDGTPVVFKAGKKYRITSVGIPGAWSYSIDGIPDISLASDNEKLYGGDYDVTVESRRSRGSVTEPVPWRVQAQVGGDWVGPEDAEWPDWLTLSSYSGDGGGNPVQVHVRPNNLQKGQITGPGSEIASVLSGIPEKGTETAPHDLSAHDIYGNRHAGGRATTANCYVIGSPGWYMFPLVYGNSIKGGSVNTAAFNPGGASSQILPTFVGAEGRSITSPYILLDEGLNLSPEVDACVLWEDVMPGYNIIDPESIRILPSPSGASLSCPYICFYISKEDIKPGNAVIAFRDKGNGNRIVWSWHVWVTVTDSSDMQSSSVVYRTAASSTDVLRMLNSDLGWSSPISYPPLYTESRSVVLRFFQDRPGDKAETVRVTQQPYSGDSYEGIESSCTYYQWGRKDPFIPARGFSSSGMINKCNSSPSGYRIASGPASVPFTSFIGSDARNLYSSFILEPYRMVRCNGFVGALNAWDADNAAFSTDSRVLKTVYDPCPPGFCVPRLNAFTGFTISGVNSSSSSDILGDFIEADGAAGRPAGWLFTTTGTNTNKTMFFGLTGMRSGFTGATVSLGDRGYFWTAGRYQNEANLAYAESGFLTRPRVDPMYNVPFSHAMTVRPVLEQ